MEKEELIKAVKELIEYKDDLFGVNSLLAEIYLCQGPKKIEITN